MGGAAVMQVQAVSAGLARMSSSVVAGRRVGGGTPGICQLNRQDYARLVVSGRNSAVYQTFSQWVVYCSFLDERQQHACLGPAACVAIVLGVASWCECTCQPCVLTRVATRTNACLLCSMYSGLHTIDGLCKVMLFSPWLPVVGNVRGPQVL